MNRLFGHEFGVIRNRAAAMAGVGTLVVAGAAFESPKSAAQPQKTLPTCLPSARHETNSQLVNGTLNPKSITQLGEMMHVTRARAKRGVLIWPVDCPKNARKAARTQVQMVSYMGFDECVLIAPQTETQSSLNPGDKIICVPNNHPAVA